MGAGDEEEFFGDTHDSNTRVVMIIAENTEGAGGSTRREASLPARTRGAGATMPALFQRRGGEAGEG